MGRAQTLCAKRRAPITALAASSDARWPGGPPSVWRPCQAAPQASRRFAHRRFPRDPGRASVANRTHTLIDAVQQRVPPQPRRRQSTRGGRLSSTHTPSRHGSSSASAASKAIRKPSAASRQRSASASRRTRSVSSSQASATSRAASSAARRSCGRSAAVSRSQRAPGPPAPGQLAGAVPAPVGDALAVAEADAHDERLRARDLARVRIGGRDAVRVQHAVQARDGVVGEGVEVGAGQPGGRRLVAVERGRVDERRARRQHRLGCGSRRRVDRPRAPEAWQQPALRRAEHGDDEHVGGRLAELLADRVAAGLGTERPGKFELHKAKPPRLGSHGGFGYVPCLS